MQEGKDGREGRRAGGKFDLKDRKGNGKVWEGDYLREKTDRKDWRVDGNFSECREWV